MAHIQVQLGGFVPVNHCLMNITLIMTCQQYMSIQVSAFIGTNQWVL